LSYKIAMRKNTATPVFDDAEAFAFAGSFER
jgi:hypothetical protein